MCLNILHGCGNSITNDNGSCCLSSTDWLWVSDRMFYSLYHLSLREHGKVSVITLMHYNLRKQAMRVKEFVLLGMATSHGYRVEDPGYVLLSGTKTQF